MDWRPEAISRSGQGGAMPASGAAGPQGASQRHGLPGVTRFSTGVAPSASAMPMPCVSKPAMPLVSTQTLKDAAAWRKRVSASPLGLFSVIFVRYRVILLLNRAGFQSK